jgi:replicative DNA helicase Mcm
MASADVPSGSGEARVRRPGENRTLVEFPQEELIAKWEEFFEEAGYLSRIIQVGDRYPEERSLEVAFTELNRFDTDMAIFLMRHPLNVLTAGEEAMRRLVPPGEELTQIHLRVKGLPRDSRIQIRDLRAKHLGQFISVEGLVRKSTEVRPRVVGALFQCLRCGTILKEEQDGQNFREPLECYEEQGGCKRSASATKFKLLTETSLYLDTQKLEIQEAPEGLRGGEEPQRLTAYVEDDLTGHISPGNRVVMNGVLRSVQKGRPGAKSTLFDIFVDVNSVEREQVEFEEIEVTEEDARLIREAGSSPDIYRLITASIAPSLYGMYVEKEALALQLFSGVPKLLPDGRRIRGDIHLLLVGDPGTGKSELLSYMSRLSPRGIYATGKAATAAGLTAAAVRDEFGEGRWTLEAGALVLADLGLACLHPDAEVLIGGSPVRIEELFDASRAVSAVAGGRPVELSPLARVTISFDPTASQVKTEEAAFVVRRRYRGPILRVTLSSGFDVRLTPDHVVLDGESFSWKPLQALKPGARLVACQRLPAVHHVVALLDLVPDDWIVQPKVEEKRALRDLLLQRFKTLAAANLEYGLDRNALNGRSALNVGAFRKVLRDLGLYESWRLRPFAFGRRRSTERLRVATLTPELAYVLGFICGDGHVTVNDRHSSLSVFQSRTHLAQIRRLLELTKSVTPEGWGMHPRTTRSRIRGRPIESGMYHMHRGSNLLAFLYRWLTDDDLANLTKLDDAALRGFLAGLMDADGCVSLKRSKSHGATYGAVELQFMFSPRRKANQRLLYALRRFDVFGRIREGHNVLIVQVSARDDARRLLEALEPYSIKTKPIPHALAHQPAEHEEAPMAPVSAILANARPKPWRLLNKAYWSQLYDLAHARRRPFKPTLSRLAKAVEPWLSPEDHARLVSLTGYDYALDRIVEVRVEDHDGFVYDLRVPGPSNFVCDGVVVHNCIDEIEKMNPQDRSAIHEAMEQQRISVAKAGITAVLQSRCAVLAAANPKFGRFDEHKYISEQIDLPPALLSRFDIIFSMIDRPQADKDRELAEHVLKGHQVGEMMKRRESGLTTAETQALEEPYTPHFNPDFLRKYVAYAKRIYPIMTDEAMAAIEKKYLDIRKTGEGAGSSVPITPRQLEAIIRLSEASARLRLSNEVTVDDADRAVRIVEYWMGKVAGEEGKFDIDIIQTGISQSQREQIISLRDIINELAGPEGVADYEDIVRIAQERGIPPAKVDSWLKRWSQEGEIYSPAKNKYKLVERL